MKVKWNLFAEGESELPLKGVIDMHMIDLKASGVETTLYMMCNCVICGQEAWIRYGLKVCDECLP
jgi:pyruvate-formate lyase-activating enzyme